MVSQYFSLCIVLAIVGTSSALGTSFVDCPTVPEGKPIRDKEVHVPGNLLGFAKAEVRIPDDGLLDDAIQCILATDLAGDGTGGTVSITGGGIGSKYVQLEIVSQFLRGLSYRVQVY